MYTIKVHLFTTDPSGLQLVDRVEGAIAVTCIILPANRRGSLKVRPLESQTDIPVIWHNRGESLPTDIPPASAGISWMYSQIISNVDVKQYSRGILNMHGGSIPEYRGANVLQWAIINGETQIGITWHQIIEEVDAGPIWAEKKMNVSKLETAWEVRLNMIEAGLELFPTAWNNFLAKGQGFRRPNLASGKVWPSRRPEHGRISAGWSERKVYNMIRALCPPWPPATVCVDGIWIPVHGVSYTPSKQDIPYLTSEGREIYLVRRA